MSPRAGLAHDTNEKVPPTPADLLSNRNIRNRFEAKSAALEVADLVRRMRDQALSDSGFRGMSQAELARRAGLSQPRISQIEQAAGRDGITYAVLRKIAYACGVDWAAALTRVLAERLAESCEDGKRPDEKGNSDWGSPSGPVDDSQYGGSLVKAESGFTIGVVKDVLFDASRNPKAIEVESRARPNVELPLFPIENVEMGIWVEWDTPNKCFVLRGKMSTHFADQLEKVGGVVDQLAAPDASDLLGSLESLKNELTNNERIELIIVKQRLAYANWKMKQYAIQLERASGRAARPGVVPGAVYPPGLLFKDIT